jgi:hypothetical protein
MQQKKKHRLLIPLLAVVVSMAMPGIAQAGDTETATTVPPVTEVTTSLPLLGTGLTVSLTRDDKGAISEVALDPSEGSTIVKENDHKVVFLLGDGDTKVSVKSAGKVVQTKVRADDPADVTGPGVWTADVFGTGPVVIRYEIGFDGNSPIITIGDIDTPEGVTAEVKDPKIRTGEHFSSYRVKVKLTTEGAKATVAFKASTHVDDEGQTKVRLEVTLISQGKGHGHWKHWGDGEQIRNREEGNRGWEKDRGNGREGHRGWGRDNKRGDD